jgi:uncharacterized protein YdcH (DUF465 family)
LDLVIFNQIQNTVFPGAMLVAIEWPKSMFKQWLLLSSVAFGVGFSVSLPFNRDLKQSAFAGLAAVPATSAVLLIVQRGQRRQFRQTLGNLQTEIHDLEVKKQNLSTSLTTATTTAEHLQTQIAGLQPELAQLQMALLALQEQQQFESKKLTDLECQQQEQQIQIASHKAELRTLEGQAQETRETLQTTLAEKHLQETELAKLRAQIASQQERKTELDAIVAQQQSRQQQVTAHLAELQAEQQQLAAKIATQMTQRDNLQQAILQQLARQKLAQDLPSASPLTPPPVLPSKPIGKVATKVLSEESALAKLVETPLAVASTSLSPSTRFSEQLNFSQPDSASQFWHDLLPYWSHRDRPIGQRFLGSFTISKDKTDTLLTLVGENLRKVGNLTEQRLRDRFDNSGETWVKLVTLALSEYAYYYSDDHFWEGFCTQLQLTHSQNAEQALRIVADHGADLLGLVRAKGGYRYVSTLWLQSGIPQQNLDHFAQLVQELQTDYSWEHLATADHRVLAEILLDTCQKQHPSWGTLKHFLAASCATADAEATEVDPISGQLVQGIAVVAQELERQGLSPDVLLNQQEREELLANSYLPQNFFLRSWQTLTKVITLRDGTSARRRLVSLRSKALFLELDLESLNAQLVLPEQTIWKPEWRNLDVRGRYCYIPEADWEATMPQQGNLNIPELVIPVESDSVPWQCTLRNHNHAVLHQWLHAGVSDLSCLIFDAITGEHMPLNAVEPIIIGVSEILCFTPKQTVIELQSGIEQRDQGIPSSLRGWRGVQLELTASAATITLRPATAPSQVITWQPRLIEPMLQGLRLQGKRPIYLDAPTLWLPPIAAAAGTLNILIENLDDKSVVARTVEEVMGDRWRSLPLQQWIQTPGRYEIKLWNQISYRWSQKFDVQSAHQITAPPNESTRIHYNNQECTILPIPVETTHQFWAAKIQLLGLWPMEPVRILLSNGQDEVSWTLAADRSGNLEISTAAFYESSGKTECYQLSCQIPGDPVRYLLEIGFNQPRTPITPSIASQKSTQAETTVESIIPSAPVTVPPPPRGSSNWYLVSIRPYKRDLFCVYLEHTLHEESETRTGILQFEQCSAKEYAEYVLVQVQNIRTARQTLQRNEYFMRIEPRPLSERELRRMRGV